MRDIETTRRAEARVRPQRPRLWKVILLNDDFTPRDFVVKVLQSVFRMAEGEAFAVMVAAHRLDVAVVAVFTREVAEEKARQGCEMGAEEGYPLTFTTEREE